MEKKNKNKKIFIDPKEFENTLRAIESPDLSDFASVDVSKEKVVSVVKKFKNETMGTTIATIVALTMLLPAGAVEVVEKMIERLKALKGFKELVKAFHKEN